MKTENQEGKHTPEQILEREAGEIFPLHSYPGNSIEGGKLYKQLQKAYIAGGHSIIASQSSELSKLREELKTTAEKFHLSDEQLKKLNGVLVSPQMRIATTESPIECDEPCYVFDGSIKVFKCATSCAGLKNCEVEIHKKRVLEEIQTNKIEKLQHSLTEREAEIERLKLERDNAYREGCETRNHEMEAKDKELDQLRLSLQCAATDANDLRESNRELVKALTIAESLEIDFEAACVDFVGTGPIGPGEREEKKWRKAWKEKLQKIRDALTKSKPTE